MTRNLTAIRDTLNAIGYQLSIESALITSSTSSKRGALSSVKYEINVEYSNFAVDIAIVYVAVAKGRNSKRVIYLVSVSGGVALV